MSFATPNFYRLYRRSRYSSPRFPTLAGEESDEVRRDRERFLAAALGFTLKHSPKFLRKFWAVICQSSNSEKRPVIMPDGIMVEPASWSDLRIEGQVDGRTIVCVLEIKAGASLAHKQNPAMRKAFFKKNEGYGWLIEHEFQDDRAEIRYVIIDLKDRLRRLKVLHSSRIKFHELAWSDLEKVLQVDDSIVEEFEAILADFGIEPYAGNRSMKRAKSITIVTELKSLNPVHAVLNGVASMLGYGEQRNFEVLAYGDGEAEIGLRLKVPPKRRQKKCAKFHFSGSIYTSTWVGYAVSGNKVGRHCWIYCSTDKWQEKVFEKLKKYFKNQAKKKRDGSSPCVWIDGREEAAKKFVAADDLTWFESIFKVLSDDL